MQKVSNDLGCLEGELSILLTDDAFITDLNRRYRGKEGPTNVLAFPMSEKPLAGSEAGVLGDIVVSLDTARREADASKEPLPQTVFRLLIHGLLHLLGYDHETSEEEALRMEKAQERLLARVDLGS
jgi:rRNA maturation RNase YbeY